MKINSKRFSKLLQKNVYSKSREALKLLDLLDQDSGGHYVSIINDIKAVLQEWETSNIVLLIENETKAVKSEKNITNQDKEPTQLSLF